MKKKLRLQIDKLRVEPFETQPDSKALRGTVHGLQTEGPDTCICGVGPSAPWRLCVEMPGTQYLFPSDCC